MSGPTHMYLVARRGVHITDVIGLYSYEREAVLAGQTCIENEPDSWHRVIVSRLPINVVLTDADEYIIGTWTREDTNSIITGKPEIQPIYTQKS